MSEDTDWVGITSKVGSLKIGSKTVDFRFRNGLAGKPYHPDLEYKRTEFGDEELIHLTREDLWCFGLQCDAKRLRSGGDWNNTYCDAQRADVQEHIHKDSHTKVTVLEGSLIRRGIFSHETFFPSHAPILIINHTSKGYFYVMKNLSLFVPEDEDYSWVILLALALICGGYLCFANSDVQNLGELYAQQIPPWITKAAIGIFAGFAVFKVIGWIGTQYAKIHEDSANLREEMKESLLREHTIALAEEYIKNLPTSH